MKHRQRVFARESRVDRLSLSDIIDEVFARQIIDDDLFARHHSGIIDLIFATSSILYLCDIVNHARARGANIYDFFIPFIL